MRQFVQPSPSSWNAMKSCWPPWRKENWGGIVTWQEPVASQRPSSKVQFKVEEEGAGRERNGQTTLLSGQGRALRWPKPLPMTVRGGDSWCSIDQCSAPMTPGRVEGFVIVIVISCIMACIIEIGKGRGGMVLFSFMHMHLSCGK